MRAYEPSKPRKDTATGEEPEQRGGWLRFLQLSLLLALNGACVWVAALPPVSLDWPLLLLLAAPFWLTFTLAIRQHAMYQEARGLFGLEVGALPTCSTVIDPDHRSEDRARWGRIKQAVERTWRYELQRYLWITGRMPLQALLFGTVATLAFTSTALLWTNERSGWIAAGALHLGSLTTAVVAATGTSFLHGLARIFIRSSGGDLTSRTFAWATRALVRVVIATAGLAVALNTQELGVPASLLLGIFAGFSGDQAVQLLFDMAASVLKVGGRPPAGRSPLLEIEGVTEEHVERLQEEGIVSVHDLAFVPTARLFFSTAYSLQQICNWQDRALLLVYVGADCCKALAQQMQIRGAIDLRATAHRITSGEVARGQELRAALGQALRLEDGGLTALIASMEHDEVTLRVRLYWQSIVVGEPRTEPEAQVGDDAPQPTSLTVVVLDSQPGG